MSNPRSITRYVLAIGDDNVTLRTASRSHVITAKILGRTNKDGAEALYLDRLVHHEGLEIEGYEASGAITTVLHHVNAQDTSK